MTENWLDELYKLHEADKAKHHDVVSKLDLSVLSSKRKSGTATLRQSEALNLLRRVQKALLGGKGVLDTFVNQNHYDKGICLMWQGPVSAARNPNPADPEDYHYILIGARDGKLYVNSQPLEFVTPDALKAALLKAAKSPGKVKPGKPLP